MVKIETVILYRSGELTVDGDPVEVNPAMVGALEPYDRNPNKTWVVVFGHRILIKGNAAVISKQLGWSGDRHPMFVGKAKAEPETKGNRPPVATGILSGDM